MQNPNRLIHAVAGKVKAKSVRALQTHPGVITQDGAIWFAQVIAFDATVNEINHCAVGSGDWIGNDPPEENITRIALINEFARVEWSSKYHAVIDVNGVIRVGNVNYSMSGEPTNIYLYEFVFFENEGNDDVIREYGFFAGGEFIEGVSGYGENGLYHVENNPDGEVLALGRNYSIKNIPEYQKNENGQQQRFTLYCLLYV